MATLPTELRRKLETAIGRENDTGGARAIAEAAAHAALLRLDVDRPDPRGHLTDAERKLRVKLRARARQLGDRLRDGRQGIDRLVEACAYEHWHRMLFARFLAENDLLWHPDGYSVTLADCAEFAAEEGVDTWEIAGRYASRVLPQIFRPDDPLLAVRLAPEHVNALQEIVNSLASDVFTASDSLGWVYQFWQARRKKQVNDREVKIGADELPAVTQLFTEPYMVDFLLQNTLGAWWVGAGRALPMPMPYLRTLDDGSPAAGRFEGWPKTAAELKVLDPCCGSGHFLVAAFHILVAFRMAEGLSARAACDAVLRDNLHGLELDNRCVQIAAFALALAAWTYPEAGGYRVLPGMNVACSGLSVAPMPLSDETAEEVAKRKEDTKKARDRWVRAGGDARQQRGMGRLFDLFVDAPVLGSLIDPTRDMPERLLCAPADELRPVLERVLNEEPAEIDAEEHEDYVAARGIAEAARLLSAKYHLVPTNVPYLLRRRRSDVLNDYCDRLYPESGNDLGMVFSERCLEFLEPDGATALIHLQSWLSTSSYRTLRRRWLKSTTWAFLARLGPGAFETISGEVVNVCLTALQRRPPHQEDDFWIVDVTDDLGPSLKAGGLRTRPLADTSQSQQLANPDHRITLLEGTPGATLGDYARTSWGISPADLPRFGRAYWEVPRIAAPWQRWQSSFQAPAAFTGRHLILNAGPDLQAAVERGSAAIRGAEFWGRPSVVLSVMGDIPWTRGTGEAVDTNVSVVVPNDPTDLPALWAFAASGELSRSIRQIERGLKVTVGAIPGVPFDAQRWRSEASRLWPNGLPEPYSEDSTQWVFKGTVTPSDTPLQVAVARLLGYRWPDQPKDALDALADHDGIVCVPPVAGEVAGAERLRDLLRAAYGSSWSAGREQTLLSGVGFANRSLEDWLRGLSLPKRPDDGFFRQHCELFHHRPFIWQVWDGHKEGFSALVNYHRLDHKLLESLAFRYLGDWIARQRDAEKRGEAGAAERLRKAEDLQRRLKLVLEGEQPYDIFVRWKTKGEQPIGWHPDLHDGVRLNIRPLIKAEVLRWTPNIKWGKDRGKNPPGAPWGEVRDNDVHLTLAEKAAAREE